MKGFRFKNKASELEKIPEEKSGSMIEKYGCGHAPKAAIFNTSTIATSAYFTWKEQVEDGDLSECFDCCCIRNNKEAIKI